MSGAKITEGLLDALAIRVCPERDAVCPHGLGCPFADGWRCDIEASRAALAQAREALTTPSTSAS